MEKWVGSKRGHRGQNERQGLKVQRFSGGHLLEAQEWHREKEESWGKRKES